jgi:Ca-activated chloride channel family protein
MILDSDAPLSDRPSDCTAPRGSRPVRLLLFLPLLAVLFHGAERHARAQEDVEVAPDDVVRVRTDLVTIPAFVTDSGGRRVFGLGREDFDVRDNNRPVQLSYFAAGTEHVALAFALDSSGSIREGVAGQREAALKLFSRFGKGSRVAIMHFGERMEWAVPFTTDAERVLAAFDSNLPFSRRTAIFDAASATLRAFSPKQSARGERRIVILISDGLDTASVARASAVIDEARARNVSVYVIHLPLYEPRDGRLQVRPASRGFRELAEKTGGRYFLIGDPKSALAPQAALDLAPVFRAIEEDLQGQYVLGFYPDDAARAAAAHTIQVNLIPRAGRKLRVRTLREGYDLRR